MAGEQDMGSWTDLLHSSSKLLEQAAQSAQFPPLQRNLDQLEALSKKLKAKTLRTEATSQSIAATGLLAREGLNAEQLARDLKSFELKVPGKAKSPVKKTAVSIETASVVASVIAAIVEEATVGVIKGLLRTAGVNEPTVDFDNEEGLTIEKDKEKNAEALHEDLEKESTAKSEGEEPSMKDKGEDGTDEGSTEKAAGEGDFFGHDEEIDVARDSASAPAEGISDLDRAGVGADPFIKEETPLPAPVSQTSASMLKQAPALGVTRSSAEELLAMLADKSVIEYLSLADFGISTDGGHLVDRFKVPSALVSHATLLLAKIPNLATDCKGPVVWQSDALSVLAATTKSMMDTPFAQMSRAFFRQCRDAIETAKFLGFRVEMLEDRLVRLTKAYLGKTKFEPLSALTLDSLNEQIAAATREHDGWQQQVAYLKLQLAGAKGNRDRAKEELLRLRQGREDLLSAHDSILGQECTMLGKMFGDAANNLLD